MNRILAIATLLIVFCIGFAWGVPPTPVPGPYSPIGNDLTGFAFRNAANDRLSGNVSAQPKIYGCVPNTCAIVATDGSIVSDPGHRACPTATATPSVIPTPTGAYSPMLDDTIANFYTEANQWLKGVHKVEPRIIGIRPGDCVQFDATCHPTDAGGPCAIGSTPLALIPTPVPGYTGFGLSSGTVLHSNVDARLGGSVAVPLTFEGLTPGHAVMGGSNGQLADAGGPPALVITPTPTATATPAVVNLGPGATLPSDSTCATTADAYGLAETTPTNVDDGSPAHWDSNNQIFTTPSYFYAHAGEQIGYANADFSRVDGNYSGTTPDIIIWAACKNGMDKDWARAETAEESGHWYQACAAMHGGTGCLEVGDFNHFDGTCTSLAPSLSAFGYPVTDSGGNYVFAQSFGYGTWPTWGIFQSKSGCAEYYTQPMLAMSTAWGEDYRDAKFRSCMNGDVTRTGFTSDYTNAVSRATSNPSGLASASHFTGPTGYFTDETNLQYLALGCIGTHYSGGWYDGAAQIYIHDFMAILNARSWPH